LAAAWIMGALNDSTSDSTVSWRPSSVIRKVRVSAASLRQALPSTAAVSSSLVSRAASVPSSTPATAAAIRANQIGSRSSRRS